MPATLLRSCAVLAPGALVGAAMADRSGLTYAVGQPLERPKSLHGYPATIVRGARPYRGAMEPIAFEKFTLSNGLDVILHEDHSLPLVAVNVWYHVGSKDEQPGKTGYAHLFEHIMFEGSKHHNRSYFDPLQQVGATLNGSTTTDRTNYWETLPSNYLELALWLEADRMGFLLDALDQQRFDIQRAVVKNERRQSYENRPYGMAEIRIQEALHPLPHPYHWPTIGYHEDLDVATLDDARAFFQRFYSPSNASLTIAGDLHAEEAKELVHRYFASLLPGPALPPAARTDSPLLGQTDVTLYDRVLLPRLHLAWPTVPRFHPNAAALAILATILGSGKSSRLYRKLVYERRIAQSVAAHHDPAELTGDFQVEATAASGHTTQELAEAARAELERVRREPPTADEMARAKNRVQWSMVRQMTNIGGFGGRADRLNAFNVFARDPDQLNRELDRYMAVQAEDVSSAAESFLGSRQVQLVVLPAPARSPANVVVDRSSTPSPAAPRSFQAPLPQRAQLANGLDLLVIERRGLPAVGFSLLLKTGAARDPAHLPGLAAFTTAMLQEGTATRTSQQIAGEFEFIGSQLGSVTGREWTRVGAEVLSSQWPKALELAADVVRNATFPDEELARVRTERVTALKRLRDEATATAAQVAPMLVYGRTSPYGHPPFGTEAALTALGRDDLAAQFGKGFGPEGSTLLVVGDVSADEVLKLAETYLGDWKGGNGDRESAPPAPTPTPPVATLYLIDKPGAAQSVIRVSAEGAITKQHPDYYALVLLNHLFGGQFTSRLNMNLRQDKGYSYGYRSGFEWYRHFSLLAAGGAVQTAVTREAVAETLREFQELLSERPVTEAEFAVAKEGTLRLFPSTFETLGQVLEQLAQIALYGLPDYYYRGIPAAIGAVSLADVRRVARVWVDVDRMPILVVGDRQAVEPGLREFGLPMRILDHEGNELEHPHP